MRPNPVTSVTAWTAPRWYWRVSDASRLSAAHAGGHHRLVRGGAAARTIPVPSGLESISTSPASRHPWS